MAPIQAPAYVQSLVPYVPGKPIEETQREYKIKRVIKLASNENPLGPSPKALAAMKRAAKDLHRYPDASGYHLKQALSKMHGLTPEHFVLGNGSEEIMDLLVRAFCAPGDAIVTSQAAFLAYKISAQIQGMKTLESPLLPDYRFDLRAMAKLVRDNARVKLVFFANPNNPTGTYVSEREVREFLKDVQSVRDGSVLVVLDSAYWEYVTAKDLPDPMKLQAEFPNVVVMRTFSKIYGLAGVRAGYGVGLPDVVATLNRVRKPFNLNTMALTAALASLSDKAFVTRARKLNAQGMKFWEKELKKLGIPFWPSQGNFLLVDVGQGLGLTGPEVQELCLRQGVIFRPVSNYGLAHALRISIGKPEENRLAARALAQVKKVTQK